MVCGLSGDSGPFWVSGRTFPSGGATLGQTQERIPFVICRLCVFVEVNRPESPYHGLIPQGLNSEQLITQATAEIETLRRRVETLQEHGGLPKTFAAHAVEAAFEELDRRGYKVARKPGPRPAA